MKTLLLALTLLTSTATAQIVTATSVPYGRGSGGLEIRRFGDQTPMVGTTVRTLIVGQRPIASGLTWSFLMVGLYQIPEFAGGNSLGGLHNPLLLQTMDLIVPNITVGFMATGGVSSVLFDVPNVPELVGESLFLQVGNFSHNANPGGYTFDSLLTSNGLHWTLGNN
jgi:hypothetical protein